MNSPDLIEVHPEPDVFEFSNPNQWALVQSYLEEPALLALLEQGMNQFCDAERKGLLDEGYHASRISNMKYDPAKGPWFYTRDQRWLERARHCVELTIERGEFQCRFGNPRKLSPAEQDEYYELEAQFFPKPGTYRWFQAFGACHFLAPWLKELGKRVFPNLRWGIIRGRYHSLPYGMDNQNEIRVLFDILTFEQLTAAEMLEFANREDPALADSDSRRLPLPNTSPQQKEGSEVSLTE